MKSYNGLLQSQYNWVKYNPWYSIWTTRVSQRFSPCFFRQISSPLATHSMYSLAPEAEAKCQRHFQPFPTPWGTTPQKKPKMEPDNTSVWKRRKHLQTTIFSKKVPYVPYCFRGVCIKTGLFFLDIQRLSIWKLPFSKKTAFGLFIRPEGLHSLHDMLLGPCQWLRHGQHCHRPPWRWPKWYQAINLEDVVFDHFSHPKVTSFPALRPATRSFSYLILHIFAGYFQKKHMSLCQQK